MIFLVILLFALFSSIFAFSKVALLHVEPFFFIGSRMFFAGIILLGYLYFFNRKTLSQFKLAHWAPLFLLGFLNIYLTNIAEIWGIKHMVSSKACLIYSLSPFMAALIAYVVLKETLSMQKWVGMLIGFMGLIPILSMQTASEIAAGQFGVFSAAELAIVVAVVCSVYGWILLKKLMTEYEYSPLLANGISMLLGGTLAMIHAYFSGEQFNPIPVTNFWPYFKNLFIIALISSVICYNLYGFLLKHFTATFMSFAGLVSPFFASLYGWMFLNEQVTWHFFVSIALFSVGLGIFYQAEIQKGEGYRVKAQPVLEG